MPVLLVKNYAERQHIKLTVGKCLVIKDWQLLVHLHWTVPAVAAEQFLALIESSTGSIFHDTPHHRINLYKTQVKDKLSA